MTILLKHVLDGKIWIMPREILRRKDDFFENALTSLVSGPLCVQSLCTVLYTNIFSHVHLDSKLFPSSLASIHLSFLLPFSLVSFSYSSFLSYSVLLLSLKPSFLLFIVEKVSNICIYESTLLLFRCNIVDTIGYPIYISISIEIEKFLYSEVGTQRSRDF